MMVAKSVGRPLSHELNVYPIAGERLFLAVGRVALAYLGTELEFASSSALDCLSTRYADSCPYEDFFTDCRFVHFAAFVMPSKPKAQKLISLL